MNAVDEVDALDAVDETSGKVVDEVSLEALDAALVRLVRAANHPRTADLLNEWAGLNLERSGYALLRRVEEHPGAHLVELAASAAIDVSTASRQIGRLVDADLVARSTDPAEHRARRHHLTAAGAAVLDRVRDARHEWLATILADLDADDRASLSRLLTHLADRFHAATLRDVSDTSRKVAKGAIGPRRGASADA